MENFENKKEIKYALGIIGGVFTANIVFMFIFGGMIAGLIDFNRLLPDIAYIINIIFSSTVFVLPLVIFGRVFHGIKAPQSGSGNRRSLGLLLIFFAFCMDYFAAATGAIITQVIFEIAGGGFPDIFETIMPRTPPQAIAFIIFTVIIAPVSEELIFRKYLLNRLRSLGDFYAVFVTALLFGLWHMNSAQFLYAFLGGLSLGYIAIWTNGVKIPLIIHIIYNGIECLRFWGFEEYDFANVILFYGLFILGAAACIFFAVKGYFKLQNCRPEISAKTKITITFLNPVMLISILLFIYLTIT